MTYTNDPGARRSDNYPSRLDIAYDTVSEPHVMDSSWCGRGSCDSPREAQFLL